MRIERVPPSSTGGMRGLLISNAFFNGRQRLLRHRREIVDDG